MKETKKITLDKFLKEPHEDKKTPEEKPETQGPYDLPDGWKWVKLREVLREDRQGINPQEFPDKKFFLITMDCIESNSGKLLKFIECSGKEIKSMKYKFNTNHILYGKLRPYLNKVYVPDREGICTTEFIPFFVEGAIREYIAFCLRRKETVNFAMSHITGTRQPRVILSDFLEFLIPLPPLGEQRRIVSRLEQLVSRAEEAKRLRRMAKEEAEKIMQAALNKVFSKAEEEKWEWVKLEDCCKINPSSSEIKHLPDDMEVTFVPMSAVSEITGRIEKPEVRLLGEVRRGYTYFKEGDVLFAKITPCMENGKSAIARNLINSIGFGSTEFHILRPIKDKVISEWLHYYIRQKSFRDEAARNMTGSVGQQRVPVQFMKSVKIPLPSLNEQRKLVTYLNKVMEKVETLKIIQRKTEEDLGKLVPAILDGTFRGKLSG
ncbi:MAG: restriction endonuclease subunit S [Thermoproteota archaeon]